MDDIDSIESDISNSQSVSFKDESYAINLTASHAGAAGKTNSIHSIREVLKTDNLIERTKTEQSILSVLSRRASRVATADNNYQNENVPFGLRDDEKQLSDVNRQAYDDEKYYRNESYGIPTKNDGDEFKSINPNLVTWDGINDPNFPRNWSSTTKWIQLFIVSLYATTSPFSSSICSLSADSIAKEFHITSPVIQSMVTSIFLLAYAIIPLFIAPISEVYGRKPVLLVCSWLLFFFNIACALSQNTAQLIIFRFIAGGSASTMLSVPAGVLSDLFDNESRGTANALYNLAPSMGPMLIFFTGYVDESIGWRWNFWIMSIISGSVALFGGVFYKETYAPTLLHYKAKSMRKKDPGNPHLKTIFEIADGSTPYERLYLALLLPCKLLLIHPMVYGLGAFQACLYGLFYLLIIAFPSVFGTIYNFSEGSRGLVNLTFGVGYAFGTYVWNKLNGYYYKKYTINNNGKSEPEFRLITLAPASIICAISVLIFGWSAQEKVHWIVPIIFAGIFGFAYLNNFLTIVVYVIDMNPRFAASGTSALMFIRSVFGFVFPLFSPSMYKKIGYGWGNTIFALLVALLGIPFPLFAIRRGKKLRLWANAIFEKDQAKRDAKNLDKLQKQNAKIIAKLENKKADVTL